MMPRLSQTLPPARVLYACQKCGGATALHRWQECGEHDEREAILLVLCLQCADAIVGQHPRLYRRLNKWHPWPGAMAICSDCKLRDGIRCTVPKAYDEAEMAVKLTYPEPTSAMVDGTDTHGKRCGWRETFWHGPVTACAQKKPTTAKLTSEERAEWEALCARCEQGGNDGADVYEAEEWSKAKETKYGQPFKTLIACVLLLLAAVCARAATPAEVVAATLVLEAGVEGRRGMEAVREVILNRAIAKGTHQLAVVREPKQFSCWNGRPLAAGVAEAKRSAVWPEAWAIIHGPRTRHVGDATHYFAPRLASPAWAAGQPARNIGRHAFLRPRK